MMRIGIDFDNTIICYDEIFSELAKTWQLIDRNFQGNKQQIKEIISALPDGDICWQRLQGKVYGEYINKANMFSGFKEFVSTCLQYPDIKLFIVSHKTEFGHFDEKKIPLRDAAKKWLEIQGFLGNHLLIPDQHLFFETTREDKIERIKSLQCTHFIDDLPEVFDHPLFPSEVKQFLFRPGKGCWNNNPSAFIYSSWNQIKDVIFSN